MSLITTVKKSSYNHKGYVSDLPTSLIGKNVKIIYHASPEDEGYDPFAEAGSDYEKLAVTVDGAVKEIVMNDTADPTLLKLGMEQLQIRLKAHDEAVRAEAQKIVDNPMYAEEALPSLRERVAQQRAIENSVDKIQDVLDNLDKKRNYKKRLRGEPAALEVAVISND